MRFLTLCALLFVAIPAYANNAYYNTLLKDHISTGSKENITGTLVDYGAWAKDARHAQAMQALQATDPSLLSGNDVMAFWINAYNLLTIDLIIKQNERKSIKQIGGLLTNPWKDYSWDIAGKDYYLDQIEHTILRPMGDPRIHMAINCASLSCPDLRNEAYDAARLNVQLDKQVTAFLDNAQKGVAVTNDGVIISKIFDWFEEDWGDEQQVLNFIKRNNVASDAKEIDGYLSYNWNLNGSW